MKQLSGPKGAGHQKKRRHPDAVEAGRPHTWDNSPQSWLNASEGPTCQKCGVTLLEGYGVADHPESKLYTYRDAKANLITSPIPLGCPVFMIDHKGMTAENRERIRGVDDRVDGVEDRVDGVEDVVFSLEDRLAALEAENAELRARVEANQVGVDSVVAFGQWLAQMVAVHAAQQGQTVRVEVEGRGRAALPPPVADLILDLGSIKSPEKVLVEAEIVDVEWEPLD